MIKEVKGRLVNALKRVAPRAMSFVRAPKSKFQQDIINVIASTVFVVGIAILAWVGRIMLNDVSVWEKGLSSILLGSRTGEAISLGLGLNLLHYMLIGSTLLVSGTAFFLRNSSVLSKLQQLVLTQVQRIKNTKSAGSFKIKNTSSTTGTKFKQINSKAKLKVSPVLQNTSTFKTKMATGLSRVLHNVNVYSTQKRKQTIIISVVAASAILNVFFLSTISAQFFTKNNIYSYGTVQIQTQTAGLNIYSDSGCTTDVSSLPWGNVSPGGSVSNLVYIKNEGDVPLTLTLETINWSPTNAPNYISLKWNYYGDTVAPNQVIPVRLTLTVSQSINGIQNFNFEIIINGSG